MKLDFNLETGLPLDFDYSWGAWGRLTWRQKKINNFLSIMRKKWWFLKRGKIFKSFFADGNGDYKTKYHQLFVCSDNSSKDVCFDYGRIQWRDRSQWMKFRFYITLCINNYRWTFLRG